MAFQTSPGINVSEVDLTNSTPAVGTTEGAIAGVFRWGPENERVLVSSEQELVNRFGAPANYYVDLAQNTNTWKNHETFFTAANFLSYSDALYVVRVTDSTTAAATEAGENFTAKYKGKLGNSIGVSHCVNGAYAPVAGVGAFEITPSSNIGTISGLTTAQYANIVVGDVIIPTHSSAVQSDLKITKREVIGGSGTTTSFGVQVDDNTDASSAGGLVAEAVITNEEDGVSVLESNIIVLSATAADADAVATGDPITYDSNGFSLITTTFADDSTGTLVNGQTYYAIRVNDGSTTKADQGKKIAVGTATRAIKLALTYEDALNHEDATPKNIKFNAHSADSNSVQNFVRSEALEVQLTFASRYTGITALATGSSNTSYNKQWGDHLLFDAEPEVGTAHVLVKDIDGEITGTVGSIIEKFENVSMTPGTKYFDGSSSFITDVLTDKSGWISLSADNATLTGSTSQKALTGGSDGLDEAGVALGDVVKGYDLFKDGSDVDISFVLQGKAKGTTGLANYIIDNIVESRRDCVAFISPDYSDDTVSEVVAFANAVSASSYAVLDSGYKYQYDKYSDAYRWVPLNGDIAGLCARTDDLRDPWFSPAGYQRGNVKNVIKLQFNPTKAERDLLYKNGVNPVITQPGQGTLLFGDKTKASTTSAFDRINVRRLFIVLEKAIGSAAKSTLFEFNDEFTRASFVNLVEPFLRDVQGRRGIFDFKVVCDQSNNTSEVIDANQFVGDIYIKPARSINFIQLNFVAVRSGVEFKEIVGAA
jgi:hypothetical protein